MSARVRPASQENVLLFFSRKRPSLPLVFDEARRYALKEKRRRQHSVAREVVLS
jgi:hypothetical protein